MTLRGKNRLKIWLVLLGVFVLGCVTGASLTSAYRLGFGKRGWQETRGRGNKGEMFDHMRRDLDLNEQQAAEIRAIIEQTRNDYRALRSEVRPRYDALRQNSRARIRALLTPEQQQRFDARTAERDARRGGDERDEH
jgi:Spy/CpxP family protein refolding chaperone